jgi:uncharacterized protein YchJ
MYDLYIYVIGANIGKETPPNPVKMVRSRFSALVYKIIPYMIATTAPSHKEFVDVGE